MKRNVIVGQSGGPTAVINSSLLGVIEEAKKQGFEHIYGALNGVEGILNERIIDLMNEEDYELSLLKTTPSAALGSGRYCLKDFNNDSTDRNAKLSAPIISQTSSTLCLDEIKSFLLDVSTP